ncbi:MAG: 4Fe-4S binding protein [Candidatus Zixiibacteriota bacterium]
MKLGIWRRIAQILGLILPNSYFQVFLKDGSIYQGKAKGIVPPILNCYATPTAYTSCPVGSIQHFMKIHAFPAFLVGILGIVGVVIGRITCGWICPFGFIQDLLHKIPTPKWHMPKFFRYFKYVILLAMVIVLPYFFMDTYFCQACPAGGLTGGVTQVIINPPLRELLGALFIRKMIILALTIFFVIFISRFFCRAFCPLGAILGLFNGFSLFSLQLNEDSCIHCSACAKVCPVEIDPVKTPNSPECLRCMKCVEKCPTSALSFKPSVIKNVPETGPETS